MRLRLWITLSLLTGAFAAAAIAKPIALGGSIDPNAVPAQIKAKPTKPAATPTTSTPAPTPSHPTPTPPTSNPPSTPAPAPSNPSTPVTPPASTPSNPTPTPDPTPDPTADPTPDPAPEPPAPLPPAPSGNKLRYAPPTLTNPITINLGTGDSSNTFQAGKDYIVKFPPTKKTGYTWLTGGRNIVIIGGHVTIPGAEAANGDITRRALYIKNSTGTVHIEGLLIDGSGGGQSDAIDISAPQATVQIENVRVDGIIGFYKQFHADVVQPFGGVAELRIDKLTGYTGYQGLQINKEGYGDIGSAKISRTNLVSTGTQIWNSTPVTGSNGGILMWLIPDKDHCDEAYPITLDQVYLQPRQGRPLGNIIYPDTASGAACAITVSGDDQTASFPNLPITGVVKKGMPPQGDFVPTGVAGVNYVSPGYQ